MAEDKSNNINSKQVDDIVDKKTQSKDVLKWVIIAIGSFVIVVFIFGFGMFVGGIKARFSYRWAESYHENFAGPKGGFFGNWQRMPPLPGDFVQSHGTFGEIIKINNSDFVIKGQAEMEKIVLIKDDTVIEKGRTKITRDDLKIGDQVVVIGSPNEQGQIEAKLVRLFDGNMPPVPNQ
jgi:hypothetical protein